ncbi:probable E3 ubiquitin-protein ligase RZFP34 isoform X2 [Andrographis paniculata]|uniref:probable E3 ubiquitin-protein ligase RZFP34 isoform X2 n=1 Tax=Andrographis paniculata TaxID=175694 RepID=UPI0021E8C688|nr:probable E3 ubiquitin-protein ligase RZFP34 isoform X2 [Andrographis paniculata]
MAVGHCSNVEPSISQNIFDEEIQIANGNTTVNSPLQPSIEEHTPAEELFCYEKHTGSETLDKGYLEYGCSHYRRRCRIRAPCCKEIFDCHHCHNEAKNDISTDQKLRHDVPRHLIEKVICSFCDTEQEVRQVCFNCGICMGKYYCGVCKLFDDDISKEQYHCNGCGICRIGGSKNFFHCNKCGCCFSSVLKNSHPCVERAMHQDCPVCFEYLFESRNDVVALACGHTIHKMCLEEMQEHHRYSCPICSKSVCDMSKVWEKFDLEIAATPMPPSLENKTVSLSPNLHKHVLKSTDDTLYMIWQVWILCNDCGSKSEVKYHVIAQKCVECKSYNTRQTR